MHKVSLDQVSFSYGQQRVLSDISFEADAGDFVCLLGPSGCGKSTLLRLLAGLDKPASGRISIAGQPVTGPGLDRGVVFQDYSLFPWLSAGENIVLALRQARPGKTVQDYREIAHAHLRLVRLDEAFGKLPGQLSGGMRQRVAIARAFAINSPVLLMDEPFGALDAVTRTRLQDLLLRLWQQSDKKKTVFFVTHDVEEAILLANRIVVLGANPGSIRGVFDVSLSRPRRRVELYPDGRFQSLRQQLVSLLHGEDDEAEEGLAA